MHRISPKSESGQAMAEYALVLAGIAMAVILAVGALGGGISDLFGSNGREIAGTRPPRVIPAPPLVYPTTLEQCVDPGWHTYPQFSSEEDCREYVEGL
jgi:Flp pilus assembly pilin Flp